jgi:protein-disulfide isomerase
MAGEPTLAEPTRRWIPISIISIVVLGLIGAIISLSVGEKGVAQITVTGTGEVQQLIGGIPQLDRRLGEDDAEVTVSVFQDVQCPRCADYQATVIDPLIAEQVRTGEIKLEFRNYPLGEKPVTLGAIATAAAIEQDRGWQYADLFLRNLEQVPEQGVNEEFLGEIAGSVPKLDVAAWEEAYDGEEATARAEEDVQLATDLRFTANPALIVEGAGGSQTLQDAPTYDEIIAAIDAVR